MGVPKTALIVDDSASIRQMVAFTLKEGGFAVLEATNGQEALERLDGGKVELIITDLNMPVMDGLTFIRELRNRSSSKHTPVLMLTTESQQSMKQAGREAGATGWLIKPFNPERLLQVIAKVVP